MPRDPKDPLKALDMLPGGARSRRQGTRKVSGTRLRKLACSDGCGYIARVSRAAIDRGLPTCCCGGTLWPWDLDDVQRAAEAGHLTAEQYAAHPLVIEYEREINSVYHGQAGPGSALLAETEHYRTPEAIAAWRVATAVRESNHAAQVTAARSSRVEDPIPF